MPTVRILVVEDEAPIRDGLVNLFVAQGHQVDGVGDGFSALEHLAKHTYAAVILDWMLPGANGIEVLQHVRNQGDRTPILLLTARGTEDDVVAGLEAGADDYVTKPFGIRELVARVNGLLRRSLPAELEQDSTPRKSHVFGNVVLDGENTAVTWDGHSLALTNRETLLLLYLIEHAERAVTREELLEGVWGYANGSIRTRTVDVHVQQLRSKLKAVPGGSDWIRTIRHRGYRFGRSALMKWRLALWLLGVVTPVLLLSTQAYLSAQRDVEAQRALEQELNEHYVEVIANRIEARLEALRLAEEAREFYLYNHFYSPPEVISLADSVAISPLAELPQDGLVLGYFQFLPDGTTLTPHAREGASNPTSERVLRALEGSPYAELRGLASHGNKSSVVLAAREEQPGAAAPPARIARSRPRRNRSPVTVSLNRETEELYDDILLSNQGSRPAALRVQSRDRQARPMRQDNLVLVDEGANQRVQQQAVQGEAAPPQQQRPAARMPRPRVRRRPTPTPPPSLASLRQKEGEVAYSQMVFRTIDDDHLVLYRAVAHQDAVVVQGVLLDRQHLVGTWLQNILREDTLAEARVLVETALEPLSCSARASLPIAFGETRLCYSEAANAKQAALVESTLKYEAIALVTFAVTALFSVFALWRVSRKESRLIQRKNDFITAVSHELRTPLTTLRMHAEMLQGALIPDEQKEKVYGELVQQSVRLSTLVGNVLELARLDDGKRKVQLVSGDLAAEVARIVREQQSQAEGSKVVLDGPQTDNIMARYDPLALEQIIVNLIDNALKYGVNADANQIQIRVDQAPNAVQLSVEDRGPGIPESQLAAVFDRFHRVEREELAHVPGTGIGLALVKELSEAQGGTVSLENLHPGIRVTVSLPAS